jgi:anti-sigma-K factor RskA
MEEQYQNRSVNGGEFSEQIPAFLAGVLKGPALRAFEERLAQDESLRAETERLRSLWEDLPDSAPETAPVDFWPPVRTRLERARVSEFPAPQPTWRIAVSFAAGIIVGLSIWLLATGGPTESTAATEELMVHDSIFETLDPIPSESLAGFYLAMLPLEEER